MNLRELSRKELEREFEARKAALIAVRDEIDRRDRDVSHAPKVEWTDYVGDGIETSDF